MIYSMIENKQRLHLEKINTAFQRQLELTKDIRKLASWGDDSNISYIHLKQQFNNTIEAYEICRRKTYQNLIKYCSKYGDDKKIPHLIAVLNEADKTMDEFLEEIYANSKNEVFNYHLQDLQH